MLRRVWHGKSPVIKEKDLAYDPADPLSRIQQNTVAIAYADSIKRPGTPSLPTLVEFLETYFPAVGGLHVLPACVVAESRFNDGHFSQVVRNRIHEPFGTNTDFSDTMEKYYSMADFVLNHVDIEHPDFQAYLRGDNEKANRFYVFSETEYQNRLQRGDFEGIFRPRPFPLFTIFRRCPEDTVYARMGDEERVAAMNRRLPGQDLPAPVIHLLSIFRKIKNDQTLLDEDYRHLTAYRNHIEREGRIEPAAIFTASATQETQHVPYIFTEGIAEPADLLKAIGYRDSVAEVYADIFEEHDPIIFGRQIRALTTFSHVQVDLNTSTYAGLKLLADDFSWYLGLDLNMLRLDAANFAFKKWKTTCFGLPEVRNLMKILYLSMEAASPRIVANLEVNDRLGGILSQMAGKTTPPPMMYDFHLASMLPAVFIAGDAGILTRILPEIDRYDIPKESIRFSLAESHDGKSVRGSFDLLTCGERQILADTVERNGGKIKYQGTPNGREPYELCISTWDSLPVVDDPASEVERYLTFYTLAFALMGRHVKSVYFNDLLGLPNDYKRREETGELRDIKRTKSDFLEITNRLRDPASRESRIARGMNHLIALVDADPALDPHGNEARMLSLTAAAKPQPVAVVYNRCKSRSITVVNLSRHSESIAIDLDDPELAGEETWYDNMEGRHVVADGKGKLALTISPYRRLWLTTERIEVPLERHSRIKI